MSRSSNVAVAALLLAASTMAYAGNLSVGNTVRTLSDTPHTTNSRIAAPNARNSVVLPAPRIAATTTALESKVVPLDQPRVKSSAESTVSVPGTQPALEDRSPVAFGITWRAESGVVNPQEIVSRAHNLRRTGLPIVHLWQSNQNLVAIGLSPRGVPGVYFSQGMSK
jgi:hypothetical protein